VESVARIDEHTLEISLDALEGGGWVYEMTLGDLRDREDRPRRSALFCYTVNRLKR